MEWQRQEDFEPSRHSRHLWARTRKASWPVSAIKVPGLFVTSGLPLDAFLFSLVILLEVYGLGNLLILGQVSPIFTLGFFAADLFFALLRHLPHGRILANEIEIRTLDETNPDDLATLGRIERQNFLLRAFIGFCTLCIIALAAIKIWAFYTATGGEFTGITLAITLSYIGAALIHIYVTGYFLFAVFAELSMQLDHIWFQSTRGQTRAGYLVQGYRSTHFQGSRDIVERETFDHKLERSDQGFTLKSWGILWDTDLHSLVFAQTSDDARASVLRAGLENQLDILRAPGPAQKTTEIPERLRITPRPGELEGENEPKVVGAIPPHGGS